MVGHGLRVELSVMDSNENCMNEPPWLLLSWSILLLVNGLVVLNDLEIGGFITSAEYR